ncbi:hypothetical protein CEXT_39961 [Caerostris extrusa]|uniref:Uncharacterized protein n=1 Tax=Caerostris extrusa TaxID=172846 RepID=A0AAV4SU22_CAEEX|nr:hypothetical protein CEXT_39961 [Caerostris extrusa]
MSEYMEEKVSLTSPGFKQWLAEAQIMGENTIVTVLDAEKVIASNVEDRENMDFEIFNKCVKALIKEKNLNVAKITNKLAAVAKALPS